MKRTDRYYPPQSGLRRPVACLAVGLCLTAGFLTASAADKTWDGGGDGYSWATSPANWDGDAIPAASVWSTICRCVKDTPFGSPVVPVV